MIAVDTSTLLAYLAGEVAGVGALRGVLLAKRLKARLADAMICQSCLDHEVPLLTRDRDFRHFARHGGLQLVLP